MALQWKKVQRADSDFTGTVTGAVSGSATINGTGCSTVVTNAANGNTSHGITSVAFDNSGSDPILNIDNAAAGLKNSGISINADGTLTGAGSGQVTAAGVNAIGTDGTGAPSSLTNSSISISAAGVLSGAGGGTVTPTGIGAVDTSLSNAPDSIKNSSVSISAAGVLSGAGGGTVTPTGIGAVDTDLSNAPSGITNSSISIGSDGSLSGAGGGQVTAAGIDAIGTDGTGAPSSLTNSSVTINADGTLNNAGSGQVTPAGVGAVDTDLSNAPDTIKNSSVSISAAGVLSGAGGGTVTPTGIGAVDTDLSNAPDSIKNSEVDAAHVGLGNVTNESKSTMFASPTFTGTVAGVTKSHVGLGSVINQKVAVVSGRIQLDDVNQTVDAQSLGGSNLATVKADAASDAESNILDGAPDGLNTLNELAAALNDDASFNTTITNSIATKGPAPLTLTAEDVDGDSDFSSSANNPANLTEGQTGFFGGDQYVVVDIS